MSETNMRRRLGRIFTDDEMQRITMNIENGRPTIKVDVHGMACNEARKFLSNLIALFRTAFRLVVIHGYTHGTAIRDMIRENSLSEKVDSVHMWYWNDGVTELSIKALAGAAAASA